MVELYIKQQQNSTKAYETDISEPRTNRQSLHLQGCALEKTTREDKEMVFGIMPQKNHLWIPKNVLTDYYKLDI